MDVLFLVFIAFLMLHRVTLCFSPRHRGVVSLKRQYVASRYSSLIGDTHIVASFYKFLPIPESKIDGIVSRVKFEVGMLSPPVKGTLYVAEEGLNGQFALPLSIVEAFPRVLKSVDADIFHNIDLNFGLPFSAENLTEHNFPFKKLFVKRRKQVLTDNLYSLDCSDAGPELAPEQWHEEIRESLGLDQGSKDRPILLDCRNIIESDIGTFAGAQALQTSKFTETWAELDTILAGEEPNRRILTFCTGGIRCVKVNAYLKQKLGFTNIGRLEKGIVAYERWIHEQNQALHHDQPDSSYWESKTQTASDQEDIHQSEPQHQDTYKQSLFYGENFLFDRRRLRDNVVSASSDFEG